MDFLNSMDDTQKIVIGVALATLIIAVVYFFYSRGKKEESITIQRQSEPEPQPQPEPAQKPPRLGKEASDKVLVMFFAPWCGHCKNMAPAWDEFTQNFDGYGGVKILKINGEEDPQLTQLHGVGGFPSVKYCPKGLQNPEGKMYQGDRTVDSLVQFLQQNA